MFSREQFEYQFLEPIVTAILRDGNASSYENRSIAEIEYIRA